MSEPKVYVVNDDAAVRESLRTLLELHGLQSVIYDSAERFLAECRADWAGCLLLDLEMPGPNDLELQRALSARGVSLPVIFIAAHGYAADTHNVLKARAPDIIEKPINEDLLLATVRQALERDTVERLQDMNAASIAERFERLTGRERQVLGMVTEGKHNREIASALGISPRTVEVYKSRMMEKLHVRRLPDLLKLIHSTHQQPH